MMDDEGWNIFIMISTPHLKLFAIGSMVFLAVVFWPQIDRYIHYKSHWTHLHIATHKGDKEGLFSLIDDGHHIDSKTGDHETALHIALREKHHQIAIELIERGASIHHNDLKNITPLHMALGKGNSEIAKVLIEKGVSVNGMDYIGLTPLHLAVELESEEIVDLLLRKGADINVACLEKETPLHLAIDRSHHAIALKLIEAGANINMKDVHELTPLHAALYGQHPQDNEIASHLIEKGADVNGHDNFDGWAPLHIVAHKGDAEMTRLLLDTKDIVVDSLTKHGETPLMIAMKERHIKVSRMLIERGASADRLGEEESAILLREL